MVLQDSVQRSLQNSAGQENNPVDLPRFAKIQNMGRAVTVQAGGITRLKALPVF